MNIHTCLSTDVIRSRLLGKHVPAELPGPLLSMMGFIKTCQTVFPSGWPQLVVRPAPDGTFPTSSPPWYLLLALVCSSPTTAAVKHLSICKWAILPSFLMRCLRPPSAQFQMGPSIFSQLSYNIPFSPLDVSVLFAGILLQSVASPSHFRNRFFSEQKL